MAILLTEHAEHDFNNRLSATLRDHGHKLHVVRPHRGEPLPPDLDNIDGLVVMGGGQNTHELDRHPWMAREIELIQQAHEAGLPIVGVCLGAQMIAVALGGEVAQAQRPELGIAKVTQSFFGTTDPLLAGIPWDALQMHAHAYEVTQLPPGGTPMPLVSSEHCKAQCFRVGLTTYGYQYHFEWDKQKCIEVIEEYAGLWAPELGVSGDELKRGLEQHYDTYRHLGDRQCKLIADRLFPLDKRLPDSGVEVANFRR
ncbi:MAG: type 1 glutamine amidotransferase [Planctomycetota bacterium]